MATVQGRPGLIWLPGWTKLAAAGLLDVLPHTRVAGCRDNDGEAVTATHKRRAGEAGAREEGRRLGFYVGGRHEGEVGGKTANGYHGTGRQPDGCHGFPP